MGKRAIFLDRDGTLVHAKHYPSRPEDLCLYDGVADALFRLQQAGFQLIVITNQGGIALGYFGEHELRVMHDHLRHELAQAGVILDGIYHCPHHPHGVVTDLAIECSCRKPQPGMLVRAAAEHGLDLAHCWFVGDILDDIEAGNRVGCRTVLVDLGTEPVPQNQLRHPDYVAHNTPAALALIAASEGLEASTETNYLPAHWQMLALETRGSA